MIGETLQLISDIVGVVADFCILVITVFTLYLTVFANKLSMISMGRYYSAFYGDSIRIFLKNKSLHSIPIKKVFLLKEIEGIFYYIELKVYEEPLIIDSWHITRISTDPFTEIIGIDQDTLDIHFNAVLGVDMGEHVRWVKPYKKAPLRKAKKAYRKRNINTLSVTRSKIDNIVVSKNVNYVIRLLTKDINDMCSVKTIFAIVNEEHVHFSASIGGVNAIEGEHFTAAGALKQYLCEKFSILQDDIDVVQLKELGI